MAGQISEQLIVRVIADVQGALSDLKKIQAEFNNTTSSASSMQKSFKQQYRAMGATYDTLGQHTEGVQAKMGMLKKEMLGLNVSSVEGQKKMQILGRTYKALESSITPVSKSALSFKDALIQLGQKGIAQLDHMSGGMVSALKKVSNILGLTTTGAVAAGAGLALTAIAWKNAIQPGIEFNMMLEQQSMAFKVMLGNAENASVMMDELKRLSLTTPIGLGEGASGTKQLIAYGFEQKEIISNLKMMTTVAKAVNVPLNDMVYVYGTLRAQGRAYTRDITQFAMRGIPIYEYLAKVLKVSRSEVKNLVEAGKVGFPEVEKAMQMMTSSGGKFFNLLEESMNTTQGRLTVLQNSWAMLTGEMASTSMGPLNSMLESLTQIVRESELWTLWMKATFGLITGLVAGLLKVVAVANSIASVYVNIYQSAVRIVEKGVEWFKNLGPIAALIKNVISPATSWVSAKFKEITATIDKWKAKLKEFATGAKQSFQEAAMFEIDMVLGGEDALYAKANEILAGLVKRAKTSGSVADVKLIASDIYALAEKAGVTADYMLQVYASSAGLTVEAYDKLKGAIKNTQNAFDIFQKRMDNLNIDDRLRFTDAVKGANAIYDAMDNNYVGIKKVTEAMKKFGLSDEEAFSMVAKEASNLRDTLMAMITTMSGDVEFSSLEDGKRIIDELMKKYLALEKETKKGKGGAGEDIIGRYMSERAEWLNDELSYTRQLLDARVGLSKADTAESRALDNVAYKYDKIRNSLEENKELMADQNALALVMQILIEEEDAERKKAIYETKKNLLSLQAAIAGTFDEQLASAKDLYDLELERVKETMAGAEQNAETAKLEFDYRKQILDLYEKQYALMLTGDEEHFKRVKQSVVEQMKVLKQQLAGGNVKGAASAAAGVIKGVASVSAQGTDMGNLISGADPLLSFISALTETVLAVENVNKVLNFMKTIMEGVTSVIEGPLNDAFQPLVNILTKVGEIIGMQLKPFIDFIGWVFGTLADYLMPLLEIIKQIHRILAPIITLILKLMTPLISILDAISQSMGLSWEMVDMQKEQVDAMSDLLDRQIKSLQDLYNIGAITGDEYSAMLASLTGSQEGESGETANPGWTSFLESMDNLLAQIVAWCNDTYELFIRPIIDALMPLWNALQASFASLKPAFDAIMAAIVPLAAAFQGVVAALGMIFGAVIGIVAQLLASPLVQGLLTFFTGTFVTLLQGALEIIIGVLEFIAPVLEIIGNVILFFKAGWDLIVGFFTGDAGVMAAALELMKKILQSIWNAIKGFINIFIRAINWLISVFEAIGDFLNGAKGRPDFGRIPLLETGTMNVPEDMLAMVHQGEMVVPRTFAEDLRNSLKNPQQQAQATAGGGTVINIEVPGNLVTENDFYKTVGAKLNQMAARGWT